MVSHRIVALFRVFSFTTIALCGNRGVFRRCFADLSVVFRPVLWTRITQRSRYGSCYTRDVILDRAKLTGVLGTEVPSGVRGVGGVTHDSRCVEPGFAFVAVPGFKRDGTEFAYEAVRRGASLIVAENDVPGAPTAVVADARDSLAALAREVNGDPSRGLEVYGVTGTNGKTTTSYALHAILAGAHGDEECGLMTTAEIISGGDRRPAVRTTPEATEVQWTLASMLGSGVRRVVSESRGPASQGRSSPT
jgi:UDP-N-acetylmuramoyl-L-alanyl-D-glutamate--2,6-diaminopimelate ligase